MSLTQAIEAAENFAEKAVSTLPTATKLLEQFEPHTAAVQTIIELAPRLEALVARLEAVTPGVEAAVSHGSLLQRVEHAADAVLGETPAQATETAPAASQAVHARDLSEGVGVAVTAVPVDAPAEPAEAELPEPPAPSES